jgi:hypothetical protein
LEILVNTPIVNQSARRRGKKAENGLGFQSPDIERYRYRALVAVRVETLLNQAVLNIKDALAISADDSDNPKGRGEENLFDRDQLQDLSRELVDVLFGVRDTAQNRTRQLRLMEEVSKAGGR